MKTQKESERKTSEYTERSEEQAFMEGYLYAIQILKETMPKKGVKSD